MIDFLSMGGYAVYVWPSYALTAVVTLANLFFAMRRRKKVIAGLQAHGQREAIRTDSGS